MRAESSAIGAAPADAVAAPANTPAQPVFLATGARTMTGGGKIALHSLSKAAVGAVSAGPAAGGAGPAGSGTAQGALRTLLPSSDKDLQTRARAENRERAAELVAQLPHRSRDAGGPAISSRNPARKQGVRSARAEAASASASTPSASAFATVSAAKPVLSLRQLQRESRSAGENRREKAWVTHTPTPDAQAPAGTSVSAVSSSDSLDAFGTEGARGEDRASRRLGQTVSETEDVGADAGAFEGNPRSRRSHASPVATPVASSCSSGSSSSSPSAPLPTSTGKMRSHLQKAFGLSPHSPLRDGGFVGTRASSGSPTMLDETNASGGTTVQESVAGVHGVVRPLLEPRVQSDETAHAALHSPVRNRQGVRTKSDTPVATPDSRRKSSPGKQRRSKPGSFLVLRQDTKHVRESNEEDSPGRSLPNKPSRLGHMADSVQFCYEFKRAELLQKWRKIVQRKEVQTKYFDVADQRTQRTLLFEMEKVAERKGLHVQHKIAFGQRMRAYSIYFRVWHSRKDVACQGRKWWARFSVDCDRQLDLVKKGVLHSWRQHARNRRRAYDIIGHQCRRMKGVALAAAWDNWMRLLRERHVLRRKVELGLSSICRHVVNRVWLRWACETAHNKSQAMKYVRLLNTWADRRAGRALTGWWKRLSWRRIQNKVAIRLRQNNFVVVADVFEALFRNVKRNKLAVREHRMRRQVDRRRALESAFACWRIEGRQLRTVLRQQYNTGIVVRVLAGRRSSVLLARALNVWNLVMAEERRLVLIMAKLLGRWRSLERWRSFACWSELVAEERAAQNERLRVNRVFMRLSRQEMRKAFQTWLGNVVELQAIAAKTKKVVARWKHQALAFSFDAWHVRAVEECKKRFAMERIVRMLLSREMAHAWITWERWLVEIRMKRAKYIRHERVIEGVLKLMWNRSLESAFARWMGMTVLRRNLKIKDSKATARWRSMESSSCLDAWREHAVEQKRMRRKTIKVMKRLMSVCVAMSFERWLEFMAELKKMKDEVRGVVVRLVNRPLSLAFQRWQKVAVESKQLHDALHALEHLAITRTMNLLLNQTFEGWRTFINDRKEIQRRRVNVLQRILNRAISRAYVSWQEHVLDCNRLKAKSMRIHVLIARIMNRLQRKTFEAWRIIIDDRLEMKRRTWWALQRMLNSAVSGAYLTWHEHASDSKRLREKSIKIVRRMMHRGLARVLAKWMGKTLELRQMKVKCANVVRRWLNRSRTHIFVNWHSVALNQIRIKTMGTRLILRILKREMELVFGKWADDVKESKEGKMRQGRRQRQVSKVVKRIEHSTMHIAYQGWCASVTERRVSLAKIKSVLSRWRNKLLVMCVYAWHDQALEMSGTRKEMHRILKRWQMLCIAYAWGAWACSVEEARLETSEKQRTLQMMGKAIKRLRYRVFARAFGLWLGKVVELQRITGVCNRLGARVWARWSSQVVSTCLHVWRQSIFEEHWKRGEMGKIERRVKNCCKLRAFTAWDQSTAEAREDNWMLELRHRMTKPLMKRLTREAISSAMGRWMSEVCEIRNRRGRVGKIFNRRARKAMSVALDSWICSVGALRTQRDEQVRQKVHQIEMNFIRSVRRRAFVTWRGRLQKGLKLRAGSRRFMLRRMGACRSIVFVTWRDWTQATDVWRQRMHRLAFVTVVRMQGARVCAALSCWRQYAFRQVRVATAGIRVIRRSNWRRKALALRCWGLHVLDTLATSDAKLHAGAQMILRGQCATVENKLAEAQGLVSLMDRQVKLAWEDVHVVKSTLEFETAFFEEAVVNATAIGRQQEMERARKRFEQVAEEHAADRDRWLQREKERAAEFAAELERGLMKHAEAHAKMTEHVRRTEDLFLRQLEDKDNFMNDRLRLMKEEIEVEREEWRRREKEWERNSAHEKEKQQIEMQAVLDECQRKVETSDTLASAELVKKIQDLENQRAKLETESWEQKERLKEAVAFFEEKHEQALLLQHEECTNKIEQGQQQDAARFQKRCMKRNSIMFLALWRHRMVRRRLVLSRFAVMHARHTRQMCVLVVSFWQHFARSQIRTRFVAQKAAGALLQRELLRAFAGWSKTSQRALLETALQTSLRERQKSAALEAGLRERDSELVARTEASILAREAEYENMLHQNRKNQLQQLRQRDDDHREAIEHLQAAMREQDGQHAAAMQQVQISHDVVMREREQEWKNAYAHTSKQSAHFQQLCEHLQQRMRLQHKYISQQRALVSWCASMETSKYQTRWKRNQHVYSQLSGIRLHSQYRAIQHAAMQLLVQEGIEQSQHGSRAILHGEVKEMNKISPETVEERVFLASDSPSKDHERRFASATQSSQRARTGGALRKEDCLYLTLRIFDSWRNIRRSALHFDKDRCENFSEQQTTDGKIVAKIYSLKKSAADISTLSEELLSDRSLSPPTSPVESINTETNVRGTPQRYTPTLAAALSLTAPTTPTPSMRSVLISTPKPAVRRQHRDAQFLSPNSAVGSASRSPAEVPRSSLSPLAQNSLGSSTDGWVVQGIGHRVRVVGAHVGSFRVPSAVLGLVTEDEISPTHSGHESEIERFGSERLMSGRSVESSGRSVESSPTRSLIRESLI